MKKRLLSALLALCMMLTMMPTVAFAAEGDGTTADPPASSGGNVAYIERNPSVYYTDLDTAIQQATDSDTVVLLKDATTEGINLHKNLTIQAESGLDDKPTITFSQYGIAIGYGDNDKAYSLTFKDVDIIMDRITSTPASGEWNWMTICASPNKSLTLDNVNMLMDAEGVSNSPHAIYFCNNNVLNIVNGSKLTIKNYPQDALEWDGGDGGYNVNITDSTFVSDHNRSGFTGTFYATITNSDVDVINSTGNGSNGSHFIIKDSTVDFSDNGSHGLSAGELSIDHSTVTANNNKGMGIAVNDNFTVKNNSNVEVAGNASNSSYGYAAVRLYNNNKFSVDSTSTLTIKDNHNTGLYVRQGNLTVEDGAKLTITGNKVTHTLLDGYGGGVYVGYGDNYDPTVTLPADAVIYNNHSLIGGDDIYVSEGVNGPSLTFGEVGSDWVLDDCNDAIDGWYDDSEGVRWEAHTAPIHTDEFAYFTNGLATVTGLTALKAAHAVKPLDPDDPNVPETPVSKSKTATNLDENYKSEVTLSLPAADEQLVSDVVFVLDKSTSTEVQDSALTMLEDLSTQIAATNAKVKVGVVIFNKQAHQVLKLTELTADNMTDIEGAIKKEISSGTNTHAGLLAGKEMLDADTEVAANRKYMVFVSDGITYMYNENPTAIGLQNGDKTSIFAGPDNWNTKYGNDDAPADWNAWLTDVGKQIEADGDDYDYSYDGNYEQYISYGDRTNHAMSIDKALYLTNQVYQEIQKAGYHCYAMTAGTGTGYAWGPSFMKYLSNNENVSFDNIQNDIYYLLDEGSRVEDYMGYVAGEDGYNFDFVNDASALSMKVDEQTYAAESLGNNQYGFALNEQTGGYDYILTYDAGNKLDTEHFVWDINVPVSQFEPVQLTYTVELTKPQSKEGIYGQYDADGSEGYNGLYTNNSATLYPVDSNGDEGVPENFAKPTVSYTVGKIEIKPADITIYTGGDGYDSVVTDEEGNDVDNSATNGLPTPGFYITLPDAVNEWLLANVDDAYKVKNAAGDEIVDLSHFLKFTYNQNGESRTWELKRYDDKPNDNNSMAYNQFIYRIEPAEVEDPETGKKEEIPIRLQFTDGNKFMTSDDFAVNLNDLFHTYDMSIYAGDLNQNLVKAVLTVNNQPVEYSAVVESGKLTVRGVTDNGTHTTEVVTEDPATAVSSVTAQVDEGTTFRINGSQLEVEDGSKVKLLVDSMVPDSNNTLVNSAVSAFDAIPDDYNHQTRYLDLVDTSNGNVYVTANDTVTLYWAYPEGTDKNTEFHLVHYEGLDRNNNDALENGTYDMELYSVEEGNLENTDQGIKITVDSFSPFALFWEDDNGGSSGGGNNKPDDLNTEDHFAYIIGYPKDYRTGEPTDDESLWPVEPQGDITRAEVATIFFRMLTDDARSENWSQINDYTDVASTDWYNNAISTLSNMGIISGDPSGAFRPDDSITRAEFTKIAVGFFDKAGDYVDGTYDDVSSSDWYADFIDAAVDLGLIEGYPDGTIRPEATITRAEACTIVNRTLGRVPDKDHLLPADEMRVWPDNSDTNEWYYAQIQEATNSHDYEWIGEENDQIENWTEKLEDRDWAQLEREWSDANSAPGGEVVD